MNVSLGELFEQARAGNRRAIGRLLTYVERGGSTAEAVDGWAAHHAQNPEAGEVAAHLHVVGITGAPGSGKSTLTGRLAARLAADGARIGVLAIDPSSPFSSGAILGDRIRMDDVALAAGVFIRSMATRGHSGGLAAAVPAALRLFDTLGFDIVIVETVGVGQVEVEIAESADSTVVVVNPGWGDAIQANKAGLLEVADIFVVNKADRPGAADSVRDLDYMLDLGSAQGRAWRPPICQTVATDGRGLDELIDALAGHRRFLGDTPAGAERRRRRIAGEVRAQLGALLQVRIDDAFDSNREITDEVEAGRVTVGTGARRLLAAVLESSN